MLSSRTPHLQTTLAERSLERALDFVSELARRYELSSLNSLLASCSSAISQNEVSVAVVGRFKAGKSSFINHFTGRTLLPVGVVPVTTIITEIRFGPVEKAAIQFLDGRVQEVSVEGIAAYVSERENPENGKRVKLVTVELPGLERFRGLRFVDTPGLESALAHNTEESMKWLPNVGLALVAVSVDPPLSHRDIELLKKLYQFTPNVTVLLTKVDLLREEERVEVLAFVRDQLAKAFGTVPQVIPYSVRPGYEDLKSSLEQKVFHGVMARFGEERRAIRARKIDTLLRECSDYIALSLKSAEALGTEREALEELLIEQQQVIADVKSQLQLIVRHAAAGTRGIVESRFRSQNEVEALLLNDFAVEFPKWTKSLAFLVDSFDQWLSSAMTVHLTRISAAERSRLSEPLQQVAKQMFRILQDFRDRLSDGTTKAFGIPLRTTELEMEIHEPESPDVRIGKIFDRNWDLLSPVIPVALIKGLVRRHLARQVSYKLLTNISRLVSQWEEGINDALQKMEKEGERRLDELVATVDRLLRSGERDRVPAIRQDLEDIEALRREIAGTAEIPTNL